MHTSRDMDDGGKIIQLGERDEKGHLRKGDPATLAHMKLLTQRRMEAAAERRRNGEVPAGRRRRFSPLTAADLEAAKKVGAAEALQKFRQKAMDKVVAQIDHNDPSIAQRAAFKVLEYTDGKPTQTIVQHTEGKPTEIVYITAALPGAPVADFSPGAHDEDDAADVA